MSQSSSRLVALAVLSLSLAACNGDDTPVTPQDDGSTGSTGPGTTDAPADDSDSGSGSDEGSTGSTSGADEDSSGGSESDGTTGEPEPTPAPELLFNHDGIARIDLTLGPLAIEALGNDPYSYVHADAEIELPNGELLSLPDIGARLKGRYGSFRTLDQKAAFLLRFDEWQPQQEPLGLEKLALNNMVQDPSMFHEQLAYALFRDAGVPAPRTGYARVFVNGELYGLYATVEVIDNSEFLDAWFGNDDGNLYEGEYGSDLRDGWATSFDLDNGTDVGFQDVQDLIDALDAMVTPQTFLADAAEVIDIDRYLQFAATEIFIGHWDGYAWTRNNYFIYRGADGRWTFLPWGTDQTFWDHLWMWGGGGRVEEMCAASVPCRQALASAFVEVGQRVETLGLVDQTYALRNLIDAAVIEDPRREYDVGTVDWAEQATRDFLLGRHLDIEAQLVCTDPATVDGDGDGASGCGEDCNDGDPAVYPGAPELCNVQDDDCNGMLDDDPMCPPCVTTPSADGTLAYCFQPLPFAAAEADCVAQGGHLVSIHDQATQDEVRDMAYSLTGGNWWLGLTDSAAEGTFAWTDGTPLDYTSWAGGEPNDWGGGEDCGHLWDAAAGLWNDIDCGQANNYVCRLP